MSIERALDDEESGVSKSVYAEGFRLGDATEICNLNNVVSCLSRADMVQLYSWERGSNSINFTVLTLR